MVAQNVPIGRLLEDVVRGRLVLPDFQRSFVWKPDDVRDLLVSVFGDYYVGSMLYMDAIKDEAPFAVRFIEGVETVFGNPQIESIIKILLDGQQRTSSLFYALYQPPLALAGRKNPFRFFMRIPKILDQDWDNSVEFANAANRRAINSLESDEDVYSFSDLRNIGEFSAKILASKHKGDLHHILNALNNFNNYEIQMIHLERGTPLERVVETFERINRTGEPLSITDLLVARLYMSKVKLRELIAEAEREFTFLSADQGINSEYILRVICLLRGKEVRRNALLELDPAGFEDDWYMACYALDEAYRRVTDSNGGYGAIGLKKWAPFTTSLVALAAFLAYMDKVNQKNAKTYNKIDQWYWTTVFANRYNEGVNTETFSDYQKMKLWIDNDADVPDFVRRFNSSKVDLQIESRSSATYKSVMCLVVLEGAHDFSTGRPPHMDLANIQDDHIFPKRHWNEDTVLNRTMIATNQKKGDQLPSRYFKALETVLGRDQLEKVLRTHFIDSNGLAALLADDPAEFLKAREARVKERIAALVPDAKPADDDLAN